MNEPQEISLRQRLSLWATAWGVTAIIMTACAPSCWRVFWTFPFYTIPAFLAFLVLHPDQEHGASMYAVFAIGWLFYVLLSIWALRIASSKVFYWAFLVLCVSLLLNCAGCQAIFHENVR